MAIVTTLTKSTFASAFRSIRPDNFSYPGLCALFDYLDEAHDDRRPYELDVIAICCEMTEYGDIEEYNAAFDTEFTGWDEVDNVIVAFDDGAIVQD